MISINQDDIIDKFQRDNSLATGGLTYETLDALKVNLVTKPTWYPPLIN